MVAAALLVGVVLAVVSVPVVALVFHLGWLSGGSSNETVARYGADGHVVIVTREARSLGTVWFAGSGPEGSPLVVAMASNDTGRAATRVDADPRPRPMRVPFDGAEHRVSSLRLGWPFESAYGLRAGSSATQARRVVGLAELDLLSNTWLTPYLPYWPGLLGNVFFYAMLALAPMLLLRWRRTRRRIRRGSCIACGYELGGGVTVCPECGLDTPAVPVIF